MKKDFVSLADERPDLAKEWNYEKNGDLKPEDVSCGSNKKVWWKLPYDVPDDYTVEHLRGKHFEFEWQATTNNRTRGKGNCPETGYANAVLKASYMMWKMETVFLCQETGMTIQNTD